MRLHPLNRFLSRSLLKLVCFNLVFAGIPLRAAEDAYSIGNLKSSVREYHSSNRENRFLIRVHVWGDAAQTGVYYLPDNTTMMDAMSLTGGPYGIFDQTTITLTATQPSSPKKERVGQLKIRGREILENAEFRNFPLQNGDVIHIDSPPKTDNLLRTMSIVSGILGIITTGLTIYLATK